MLLARAHHPRPNAQATTPARLAPRRASNVRCRYTTGASDPRRDRFAETVLFTAADDDDAGALLALDAASQSAMIALLEKGVSFRHVLVRHDAPEQQAFEDFRELYSAANPASGPCPSPPLLADCGNIIASAPARAPRGGGERGGERGGDARVVLEYIAAQYASVGTPLVPSSPAAAATMRLFVDVFAGAVVAPFRRYVNDDGADAAAARAKKEEFLEGWRRIDAFLLAHAHGAAAGFDALDAGAEMLFGQHRAFVVRPPAAAAFEGEEEYEGAAAAADDDRDEQEEEEEEREDEGSLLDGRPPLASRGDDPAVDRRAAPPPPPPPHPHPRWPPEAPYLLGRHYSLAEVAATPHVARMAALLPALKGGEEELAPLLRGAGLERAAAWCEACLSRPSAVATDPTADELLGGIAAAEWARA